MSAPFHLAPSVALPPGSIVAGRYEVIAEIGRGGMGTVLRAIRLSDGGDVALKVLQSDRGDRTRAHREARIARTLMHPNVVRVHDITALDDGSPVIVMERLRGETLRARLDRDGALPLAAAASIVLQIADAVSFAHAIGIVHRDLKPENVMLCPSASDDAEGMAVKVLDFGIAKLAHEGVSLVTRDFATHTDQLLGTPHYMSPEQIFGERDVDGRADVWALGVILYEMLSGKRPFRGDNAGQVFKAIAFEQPAPLDECVPGLPAPIATMVLDMLSHSRANRLADMQRLSDVLGPFALAPAVRRGAADASMKALGESAEAGVVPSWGVHSTGRRFIAGVGLVGVGMLLTAAVSLSRGLGGQLAWAFRSQPAAIPSALAAGASPRERSSLAGEPIAVEALGAKSGEPLSTSASSSPAPAMAVLEARRPRLTPPARTATPPQAVAPVSASAPPVTESQPAPEKRGARSGALRSDEL